MIRVLFAFVIGLTPACAQVIAIRPPQFVNDYPSAHVFVYHTGNQCRMVVSTPSAVIETSWARCTWTVQP